MSPHPGVGPASPAGNCSKEKRRSPTGASRNPYLQAIPHRAASASPLHTGHRLLEQRPGATRKLPPPAPPLRGAQRCPGPTPRKPRPGPHSSAFGPSLVFNPALFLSTQLLTVPTGFSNWGPPAPPWGSQVSGVGRSGFYGSSKLNFQLTNWELQEGNLLN